MVPDVRLLVMSCPYEKKEKLTTSATKGGRGDSHANRFYVI